MKQSRAILTFHASTGVITLHRALVARVLGEYRPEAASLSIDVFNALQSAVDGLIDEGGCNCTRDSTLLTSPPGGNTDDVSLVPLVFVAHLVEELSSKSPFITNIGCEQSVVAGTSIRPTRGAPLIASRIPGESS